MLLRTLNLFFIPVLRPKPNILSFWFQSSQKLKTNNLQIGQELYFKIIEYKCSVSHI
jgi:hypothetical protein